MNSHRLLSCSYVLFVVSIFALATGCGSVSSGSNPTPTPTPTATPTPGTTPSPTPVPTPSPSPTPTPTPGPSNAAITGRVVDPSGAPVVGTVVVALELSNGDFFTVKQVNADANGNFRFDNVAPIPSQSVGYAIMVAARAAHDPGSAPGSPGSFYAPALLEPGGTVFGPGDPIVPGTNVGTIQLRFSSQGDIEGNVTSTDSSQTVPVPIQVKFEELMTFTQDFEFDYPWINPPPFDTAPGTNCPAGNACASYQIPVLPTDALEEAAFSKAGYIFKPSQTPGPNFTILLDAFSLTNGKPDCATPVATAAANNLRSDSPNQAGTAQFSGCN